MITGIVEVTQDPEQAGSTLKILSLRLRGMKGALEELGEETDENVENISKMQGQILNLTKGKVNIFDGAGEFRSTYEIMQDIASVWDELNSKAQADLLETIAGKHRANSVAALLSNWKNVEAAVKSASEAEGSAARENAKYVDSLQGRLDKLTTAWQSFANTFMDSSFLKGGISVLTKFVELIEKLADSLGSFGTIGLVAGIVGIVKNFGTLRTIFASLIKGTAGAALGFKALTSSTSAIVGGIGLLVAGLGLAVNAYKNYKEEISKARQETIKASDEFLDASGSFEQAYIKYSGRTDLTAEEESELENAIKGTADALDDKSSALQGVINSSNDYLSSLERIAQAELEAADAAAKNKRNNAELELKDLVKGWSDIDGSEVNISVDKSDIGSEFLADSDWFKSKSHMYGGGGRGRIARERTYNLELSPNASASEILNYYYELVEIQNRMNAAAEDNKDILNSSTYTKVSTVIEEMSDAIAVYESGVYDAAKAQYQLANGIPKTTEEYLKMRESILRSDDVKDLSIGTKQTLVDSLDSEYGQLFDLSSAEAQARKFVGIIKGFGDGTKDGTNEIGTVETFLNMKTALNNNECTVEQYLSELDNVKAMSEKFNDEEKKEFNLAFGIDDDAIKKQYEDVYNYISRNYLEKLDTSGFRGFEALEYVNAERNRIESLLNGLTATELQAVANIKAEIDWETTSTDKIFAQIKKEAKFLEAMNFTIAMDVETESLDALNGAMAESVSAIGLSSESIAALKGRYAELASQGYDLSTMFEETSNGIHLNRKAVDELEQALASQKLSEIGDENSGALGVLKDRYDELTGKIENCNDASERASLYTEQQEVAQKINDLATLASQYEGLTSAYNAWLSAEEAGSERDMYENIIEGFETVGDEISRGWLDDGTVKFLEMLTGRTDLATMSAKELKEVYKGLDDTIKHTSYSVRDFFTVDEDGNSTSKGVYNFLDAVGQLEEEKFGGKDVVKRDKNGKIISFDFQVAGGDKAIADALGISEELVQIMQRAADDAGFVVTLDGTYTQLADLKTSAEESENALKKLKSNGLDALKDFDDADLDFDFDANNLQDLNTQLEKATTVLDKFKDKNGQLKKDKDGNLVKGAKQALEIASYFTATLDKLTEPVYMQLETNQVEKDLQEPLEKMQEFERLSKEKHQLELTGDTKGIKEVEKEMNEIVDYIYENDDLKARLEIEGLSKEEIKAKLEKGEIEIPATVDIQLEMSEDIKDMRLMMMNQLGLITDEQLKLEIEYDVDYSTVEGYEPETQKAIVEYFAEHEEVDKYEPEDKKALVRLIAEKDNIDNWKPEDVDAVVKYYADDEQVKEWSPEEKKAYAKYLVDGGEVDGWSPEAKDAFVKYLVDGGDPDKFDPDDKESWVVYDADTRIPDGYIPYNPNALVTYNKDSSIPDNYNPDDPDATVRYGKDSLIPDNYIPLDPPATVVFDKDTSAIDTYDPPDFVRTVTYKIKEIVSKVASGGKSKAGQRTGSNPDGSSVNGTANVSGTVGKAFKQGSWGTKNSGTALVGELGREVLVRDGRYYTIGDNGAEFIKYKKGDIIFNHVQSEQLFKNGKVTAGGGRAKALVNGTALLEGTAFGKGTGGGIESETKSTVVGKNKNTGKSYKKSSDSSDSKDDFEETIDLIEIALSRIQREIDNLDKKANNVYKSWSSRNKALTNEISKVRNEINLQQRAYEEYLSAANGVGLSSSWKTKIQNGEIDIETIKDEVLADKISDYQNYYEAALKCKDAIEELKETEAKLYAQRFENIQTQYDGILQGYEHTEAMLNEYINQAEEQGLIISKKYYDALIANEKSSIAELRKEQANLIAERDNAVAEGKITEGSQAWLEQCAAIDEVTQAIEESNTAILEYSNSIRDIDWEIFDLVQERISAVSEEADFLIELMSNKKLFEDDGKLTSQGLATVALHAQNYNSHMFAADEYGAEIANLDAQIVEDPYNQDLIERRNELLELQRESILAAEDEKNAIVDLVEESMNLELDALQELIDKKNEALESERDLYEYQKKVKEQTEEIASLEKQLAAYSGDDSEEAKQKIQQIKVDLETARQDLEETEYDKFISDTSAMLDTLYTEYELILNQRLDNIDALLEGVIESINIAASADGIIATALGSEGALAIAVSNNATSIKDTLTSEAKNVGITLSDAMNNIWSVGEGNAKSVLTMYGNNFQDKLTTTNSVLNDIKADIAAMVDDVDKDAQKKTTENKTSTSAKKDPTKDSSSEKKTPAKDDKKPTSSGDGKPKVGDKVKFVSGKYYYDSQGKKPLGSKNRGKEVYITSINTKSWATHPYHISTGKKLGSGDLGWLKLDQLSGYATGGHNFANDELAWTQEGKKEEYIIRPSDGAILTPIARKGSVLNAQASNNLWSMANSPAEFIKDNLNLGVTSVPNNSSVNNVYSQTIENVTFSMPNVHSYNEMLAQMQRDPKFDKLIKAMTLDQIAGKSSLTKGKSIR